MQNHYPDPPIDPDRLAAHEADQAYRSGAWLRWYLSTDDREPTGTEQAMLGGKYDDRALRDEGYDGVVLAQGEDPLRQTSEPQVFIALRALRGELNPTEQELYERRARLKRTHEYYTSPVVREPARLLSNEALVDYEDDPRTHVWTLGWHQDTLREIPGDEELFNTYELPFSGVLRLAKEALGLEDAVFEIAVPDGYRLIVRNIPKGSKHDTYPYTPEKPLSLMELQIYHNSEGYLVADKVFPDGRIAKKQEVALKPSETTDALQIDETAPNVRAMDSLWVHNSRKAEYINPLDPTDRSVFLLSTTSLQLVGESTYDQAEITATTPDDSGNKVIVTIENLKFFDRTDTPTSIVLAKDTARHIAPAEYQ